MRRFRFGSIGSLLALCALLPVAAIAHDLQTTVRKAMPYVEVSASYEGTEPASFISVTVNPPEGSEAASHGDAFQTGRTDYTGRFVFLPSGPGEWEVVLDDELGHKATLTVSIGNELPQATDGYPQPPAQAEGLSTEYRLLVGLSLIAGLAGLLYGWTARRQTRHG